MAKCVNYKGMNDTGDRYVPDKNGLSNLPGLRSSLPHRLPWRASMKKRWHQSIGCFGFRRPHIFSKPTVFNEKMKYENPSSQNSNPDSPTFTKIQNSPTFNDSDPVLNTAPIRNDICPYSTSQVTTVNMYPSNVLCTKNSDVGESGKYLVYRAKTSEPLFSHVSDVRKQKSLEPKFRVLNSFDKHDVQELSRRNTILNYPFISALKVDPSKIEKNVDIDAQYEKQTDNNGKCCDPNSNVSEDVYNYSSTSSCTNYVNPTAGKCSDEKLISRSYIFGTPTQRSVYPAKFFPLLESNSKEIYNNSSSSEFKGISSSLFTNEQKEMVEELQATKLILLKLKRLLIETPTSEKSVCSSTFAPANTYNNSLHSHKFVTYHCDLNEGQFPSTTSDNRPLPFAYNKPMNRTGLEELIDSLSQLHFEKSEILCAT
ncbi:hypothetical protein MN116_001513 [Schistosoma mekongi]|uniref:Uncharacterized protein n=1 Tax=Schistosoma mekongi TaxID=38744 RepID=A0AAE1ZLW6_SCHME|nr:hypothetical protein MN116_001513 [Schistosoma mekongi]